MARKDTTPPEIKLAIAERRVKVWDLRLAGATFAEIAHELGVSVGTVHSDIHTTLKAINNRAEVKGEAWKKRLIEIEMRALAGVQPLAEGGDIDAGHLVVKHVTVLMKLTGAEAATKIDATHTFTMDMPSEDTAADDGAL